MTFETFSQYLKQLEDTSSRLKITEILVGLLKEAKADEVDKICYLSLGQLAPLYEGIEFNMAEKLLVRAVSQAFGVAEELVKKEYKKVGDLGEVGYGFKVKSRIPKEFPKGSKSKVESLSVTEVYEKLLEIAREGGAGSVERKVNKMAKLLNGLDGLSVKYVVRVPLGRLRLGFSDLTIMDALSWMAAGDKSKRQEIEEAFNVQADIGHVARAIKEKGLAGLKGMKIQLGTPVMPGLCQRLPTADEMIEKMGKVAVEPKFDGQRCVGGMTGVYEFSRGFTPIKDLKEGDKVLTHNGRFMTVVALSKRLIEKKEKTFNFQTFLGDGFKITTGHRLLVKKGKRVNWEPVDKVEENDWLVFPFPKLKNSLITPTYLDFVTDGGYRKKIILTEDFYRFLGFWVGDGYTNIYNGNRRVGISFNAEKEEGLAKEYKTIIRETLGIRKITTERRRGALNLYWTDWMFLQWLCKNFRINQHGKTIPKWFANISPSCFEAFLKGWIEADGTNRHSGGIRLTTKERELASFGQLIALQFGKVVGLRRETIKLPKTGYSGTYYSLIFPGTTKQAKQEKNYFLIKVLKKEIITKPDYRTPVYNLQVANDESYLTSMVCLHNCQIHFSRKKEEDKTADGKLFDFTPQGFIRTFTRNLENNTRMFPDIAQSAFREIKADEVILDGEAIGYDTKTGRFLPFQETIKRKRKYDISETAKKIPLKYFCFDILYKDGRDLLKVPFSERRKILEKVLDKKNEKLLLSPQIITNDPRELRRYHDEQKKKGLEGIVVKKWQAPYDPGRRGFTWVKFKEEESKKGGGLADTLDCVVMGYYKGKGKRTVFGVGAFLIGIRENETSDNFLTISKIGTGLTDEQWRELKVKSEKFKVKSEPKQYKVNRNLEPDVWCDPGIVVEIQADNITISPIHTAGLALRFPRLVRFRDLKAPEEATTLQEAKKLYGMQK